MSIGNGSYAGNPCFVLLAKYDKLQLGLSYNFSIYVYNIEQGGPRCTMADQITTRVPSPSIAWGLLETIFNLGHVKSGLWDPCFSLGWYICNVLKQPKTRFRIFIMITMSVLVHQGLLEWPFDLLAPNLPTTTLSSFSLHATQYFNSPGFLCTFDFRGHFHRACETINISHKALSNTFSGLFFCTLGGFTLNHIV